MKKTSFLPLMAMGAAICFATSCGSDDPGTLNGEFSVSPTLKVKFAQGNLQYQPSTKHTVLPTTNGNALAKNATKCRKPTPYSGTYSIGVQAPIQLQNPTLL